MDFPSSVGYLYSLGNEVKTIKLGLERIQALLHELGDPQLAAPVIHIAGTNGKGSVSAMVESALLGSGFRTGLFTSPHLISPVERIRIAGEAVSEAEFAVAFDAIHEAAERLLAAGAIDCHPTYFESVTAMAFWMFRRAGVERMVIEVGLGGRLDATNVVQPELAVITPVDYDHQQYLGDTLIAIAGEKAGIIKPGIPYVLAPQREEAAPAFPLAGRIDVRHWATEDLQLTPEGCRFVARQATTAIAVDCPLPGDHQAVNALTAVVALHQLGLSPAQIHRGIANVDWPGRLEIIRREPLTYLDGAHNPAGAQRLADFIQRHFLGREIWIAFGVMRDKSVAEIVAPLFPLANRLILTRAGQPRALEPEAIAQILPHPNATLTDSLREALDLLALAPPDAVIFITGSLFVVGEARGLLK